MTTVPASLRILLKGQLNFMSQTYDVLAVSSSGKDLHEFSSIEKIRSVAIEMTRKITPFKDVVALFKLIRLFMKEKPYIVHTHTPKAGLLGMLAAWLTCVPNRIHTVAGMPLLTAKGKKRVLLDFVEMLTYRCATKVCPNSMGLKKIIMNHAYTSENKLEVIAYGSSNGIDTSYFNPALYPENTQSSFRTSLGIQKDDFVFLFVGRLVGDKGINELVRSFSELSNIFQHIHLVLVGEYEENLDPLHEQTLEIIHNHPMIHNVGYQKDVRMYFSFADVMAFPSYREGFPNAVMQAASMQLNVIVSDINGCNEIVTDGVNGWIVPVRDTVVLYDKMEWCILNAQKSKQMGKLGRNLMKEKYEQSVIWKALLDMYNQLKY